jgi:hypothetical protein
MAGSNMQNTTNAKTQSFTKGMNKDTTDIFMSDGLWYNAINAINNSHYGETGSIGNEPSNRLCTQAPYTIIGYAFIRETEWLIFSTNNVDSEIGIFDESKCSYKKLVNDTCLNFKTTNLITAHVKENYDCTFSAYWQDNLNPDRTLNINDIPYICEPVSDDPCDGERCTDRLDCDKIRLHPLIKQPCVNIRKAIGSGQIINGSYMATIAYSENGIRLTEYAMPSVPQGLWKDSGFGGSLEINIEDLDDNFEEYELVIISVNTQNAIAKKIGYYNINQRRVVIDVIQGALETVPLSYIPLRNVVYDKSEKMAVVNGYLIRSGVSTQPYINYQLQANKINTNWVAVEYDTNYYWNGGNVMGYMRDEVYSFFIRWIYNTGNRTASYHIPGRPAIPSDLVPVSGSDVVDPSEQFAWQVYDTATRVPATGVEKDNGIVIARGSMAYWESIERYPTNPEVWGDLCYQPIRHHKMPSNETIHIHNQGGSKIIVLGVEFTNIEPPIGLDGNPVTEIVGYEILRGSREGNKSIVAKGIFANMLEFNINGQTIKKGLMQNYPYNDVRPDPFLSDDYTILDNDVNEDPWENASKLDKYKKNYLSFHSVETNFERPAFGTNYVKIYTEEKGTSTGQFELPYKHPRFKLLTDNALTLAFSVGLGIALIEALGKSTLKGGNFPLVAGTGGLYAEGERESGPANTIADLISGGILSAISTGGQANLAGTIAGIISFGISLGFWIPRGMSVVLDLIRNMATYRDYVLQYNSHGFYSNYTNVNNMSVPSGYNKAFRRRVQDNMIKYIGMHIQDFDNTYRINNLYRTKFVCLKLTADLPFPASTDDSKKRVKDVSGISYKDPFGEFTSNICQYYGAIKVDYQNQYGQLYGIVQIPTDSCIYETNPAVGITYSTNAIFGGDVYINRYTEKNAHFFFNTWMLGELDGTEWDYRNHVNGPAPRYWANLANFDGSDFNITWGGWNFPSQLLPDIDFNTPSDNYRLDATAGGASLRLVRRNSWFYLFYNGVRDYFTESELNMAYRDYGVEDTQKFYDVYGQSFNDLSLMFRSDVIKTPAFYKYDLSLSSSKLFNNLANWGNILPRDYDPQVYSTCFEYYPRRSVYSLRQQAGLRRDNWRNYLPLNYKDFNGRINIIKPLNATGCVILFEDAEPTTFVGVDQLQTQGGVKVTIGDSGLFQQNFQSLVNADDALAYGASISSRAAVNTPYGLFFVSQDIGKIFVTSGSNLDEISRNGLKFWFAENLPSKMLEVYPNYPLYDNPVAGIGVQAIYDSTYELVYFSKRDYLPLRDDLLFDDPSGVPYYICGTATPAESVARLEMEKDEEVVVPFASDAECAPALDIAIVLDITGSMGAVLTNVKASIVSIANEAALVSNNDYRIGLITVNQITSTSTSNTIVEPFSLNNIATLQPNLNAVTLGNGVGIPEPTDVAIRDILEDALGAFRSDATKMIIVITDAVPSGEDDDTFNAIDQAEVLAISNLAASMDVQIYPIATGAGVSIPDVQATHNTYATTTGGTAYNSPSGAIGPIVQEIIKGAECPVSCEFSISKVDINQGESVQLTWSSSGATGGIINPGNYNVLQSGTLNVTPLTNTTYTLTMFGVDDTTSVCTVSVKVEPAPLKCPCAFDDPLCFEPCDWTVSYDPKSKVWVSFHDWHPSLMMPSYQNFYTIKNNEIWKHNDRWDSFCNYYGTNYPWEIEYPIVTPNQVTTLRSFEYYLDVYKFYNDGKDFFHVLDQNFDRAIIYNSEQISGILRMRVKQKNNPMDILANPVIGPNYIEILFSKEENKYRFNTFWDITNDRGEFSGTKLPMWNTKCSGYKKDINPNYVNYDKSPLEHKKFRHYGNRVILRKNISGDNKMILKLINSKNLNSPR